MIQILANFVCLPSILKQEASYSVSIIKCSENHLHQSDQHCTLDLYHSVFC